jgi:hypothetical protein
MEQLRETQRHKGVPLGVLVRPEQREALTKIAHKDDRSISSVARAAIDVYLEREREQHPRPPRTPATKEANP